MAAHEPSMAYFYSRVSSAQQYKSHLSLETQAADCLRYYDYKLAPAGVLIPGRDPKLCMFGDDRAISSRVPILRREAAIAMDKRLKPGDHIVFPKIDRAWRSMRDAVLAIDYWRDRGIHVHFASENMCESNDPKWRTPMVKVMLYTMTMCAEMERDRISERMRDAYAAKRARGLAITNGSTKLGWKWSGQQMVPDKDERTVMALIRHMLKVQGMAPSLVLAILWGHNVKLRKQQWKSYRSLEEICQRAIDEGIEPSLKYWTTAARVPTSQRKLLEGGDLGAA